jgi:DNA-binding GntR family transcriptional regulator
MAEAEVHASGQSAGSRADLAYTWLREAFCTGRYRAGDRLREEEIAARLGISRTPVREALRRCEAQGLLRTAPGRGLVVASLERGELLELYAMRELLEGAAARLAAINASPAEVAVMQRICAGFAREIGSPDRLAAINRNLHEVIAASAHNRYLSQSLDHLSVTLALLADTTFSVGGRPGEADAEHRAIVGAIARRDADAAERLARAHIRGALEARIALLSSR